MWTSTAWQDKKVIYGIVTMTYGAARKAFIVKDATLQDLNTNQKYPMPIGQKMLLVGTGALSSIYLWPFYLAIDAWRFDLIDKCIKGYPERPSSILDWALA